MRAPRRQHCGAERRAWQVILPSRASCALLGFPGRHMDRIVAPGALLLPAVPATPTRHALCHCHCPGIRRITVQLPWWEGIRLWQEAECRSGEPHPGTRWLPSPPSPPGNCVTCLPRVLAALLQREEGEARPWPGRDASFHELWHSCLGLEQQPQRPSAHRAAGLGHVLPGLQ